MKRFLALALLVLMGACRSPSGNLGMTVQPQTGTLETADAQTISYFYLPGTGDKGVILLHMLGRSKEDYAAFAQRLNALGLAVIAIDFRGHGKSSGDITKFTDDDYRKFSLDVKAAKQFLAQQGVKSVGIVGASIGANTALNYATNDPDVVTVVMLSPGMNYHGVTTEESMKRYSKQVMLVAAEDDRDSAIAAKRLAALAHASMLKTYRVGGHGTALLGKTDIDVIMIDWFKKYLSSARLL